MDERDDDDSVAPPLIDRIRRSLGDQTSKERGAEKLSATLSWLFMWHVSTPGLIRRRLGILADGYATQLSRSGEVSIFKCTKIRGGLVVMLSETGLALAEGMFPRYIGRYDPKWTSVKQDQLVHDLAVQLAVLSVVAKRPVYRFLPETMAGLKSTLGSKRPDCRIWFEEESLPFAMEVERSSKKVGRELDNTLCAAARAIEKNEVAGQIFMFMTKPTMDLYRDTLAKPLPRWEKDAKSKKWVDSGRRWNVPTQIQERFQWLLRPDLFDGFLP